MTAIRYDHGMPVDFEEKAVSETGDCWTVTGYGSVFGNTDLGGDVVVPGAFAKSLRDHGMPMFLFNHKMDDAPIGTIVDSREDRRGLWFKAELPKDDSFVSGRIIPQLKKRGLRGTSIGYKATQKETRKADNVRLLKEIRLHEISIVTFPMNILAGVETVSKSLIGYQDMPLIKDAKTWDAKAAFARLKEKMGAGPEADADVRQAFIFADAEKAIDDLDLRFLIADVDENSTQGLAVHPVALYKCLASVVGARDLPEDAQDGIRDTLERHYKRLGVESPFSSISIPEWKALDFGEREARLRGLGVTRDLAKSLATTQLSGQREADRSKSQREAGSSEDAKQLLSAFASIIEAAAAINKSHAG